MDWIDEIEGQNHRNIETAELVSAYMRANAQRAAQKKAQLQSEQGQVPVDDAPKEQEQQDKLDFSSEFSTGDMGLNSQGGFQQIKEWKRQIEEDEEEGRRKEDPEEEEQAEEWSGGGWQEKQPDSEQEPDQDQDQDPSSDSPSEEDVWTPPSGFVPSNQTAFLPPKAPPSPPPGPRSPQPPLPPLQAATCGNAPAALVDDPNAPAGQITAPRLAFSDPQGSQRAPSRPINTTPIVVPERLRPLAHAPLPASGQLAQIDPDLAEVARRLIATPAHEEGYEECVRLLARFGIGALRLCSRSKVSIEILDEQSFGAHPSLLALGLTPEETPSDGAYIVERRLVLVDRRSLTGKPRFFHPALYYFAHAFDHAQGGETFSSRKAAAVVACFEASTRAYLGFDFVDELAAADPVRYFARSVAVYLGRDDCEEPLWSHQDLFDFDRSMYEYLQYLFARLAI